MANGFFSDLGNFLPGLSSDVSGLTDAFSGADLSSGLGGISDVTNMGNIDVVAGALSGTLPSIFASGAPSMAGPSGSPYVGTGAMIPAVMAAGRSMMARFPQLGFAIQAWRAKGVALSVDKLWALLRRFGPELMVSAGILTAGALTELLLAHSTHKRRRMNCLNPKALRRSTRRLLCFERRACKVQHALSGISGGAPRHRRRTFAARCHKCRRSPCVCN